MAEFGYHTIGDTAPTHSNAAIYADAHLYSPAEDGVLDSIFVYCRKSGAGTIQTRFAIYDNADDSLVAETVEIDVGDSYAWYEAAVVGEVDVLAAKSYYFAFKQSDTNLIKVINAVTDRLYDFETYGDPWTDPGNWTTETGKPYRYSAYATYTPGGAEVELAGTIAAQSGMSGALKVDRKLAGTIEAQSGLSGELHVERKLAGVIAAHSGMSGSLHVERKLAGVIAAQSGMSGSLSIEGEEPEPPARGTFASLTRDFWWLD